LASQLIIVCVEIKAAISSRTGLNRKRIGTNNFIISNLQTINNPKL